MSRANFYRGTSFEQDGRFKNKEKLNLKNKHFPPEYETKVDMKKVKFSKFRLILKLSNYGSKKKSPIF